jgi:hypothetical protein
MEHHTMTANTLIPEGNYAYLYFSTKWFRIGEGGAFVSFQPNFNKTSVNGTQLVGWNFLMHFV